MESADNAHFPAPAAKRPQSIAWPASPTTCTYPTSKHASSPAPHPTSHPPTSASSAQPPATNAHSRRPTAHPVPQENTSIHSLKPAPPPVPMATMLIMNWASVWCVYRRATLAIIFIFVNLVQWVSSTIRYVLITVPLALFWTPHWMSVSFAQTIVSPALESLPSASPASAVTFWLPRTRLVPRIAPRPPTLTPLPKPAKIASLHAKLALGQLSV